MTSPSESDEGSISGGEEEEYMFYKDRPEWKDIEPIPQDDGPNPVAQIAYTERFQDVYDYVRAVINKNEKSERAFKLTSDAIECNPANYTVWHYRREILHELKMDLTKELDLVEEIVLNEPKNYQVWFHRQKLIEWTSDSSKELNLTAKVFDQDSKNYHAWQHRQWVIKKYNLWDGELEFIDQLLKKDLRNNSAWNQRYFVISNTTGFTNEVIQREVEYTLNFVKTAPNNESSWNYLLGILKGRSISDQSNIRSVCDSLRSQHVPSPFLLSTLIDIYEEEAAKGNQESLTKALELCEELSTRIDPIRERYWKYIAGKLQQNYGEGKHSTTADPS